MNERFNWKLNKVFIETEISYHKMFECNENRFSNIKLSFYIYNVSPRFQFGSLSGEYGVFALYSYPVAVRKYNANKVLLLKLQRISNFGRPTFLFVAVNWFGVTWSNTFSSFTRSQPKLFPTFNSIYFRLYMTLERQRVSCVISLFCWFCSTVAHIPKWRKIHFVYLATDEKHESKIFNIKTHTQRERIKIKPKMLHNVQNATILRHIFVMGTDFNTLVSSSLLSLKIYFASENILAKSEPSG